MSHNLSSFFSASNSDNGISHPKKQSNVCMTLPITCQICLGKVKDPSVCPNLHAFCSFCIDIWLEKTKQCPTCRISITKENPCRKILGGLESTDEVDQLKPSDFSHPSTRKARFLHLYQEYEDEINRLNKYIDSLNDEINKLKENNASNRVNNCTSSPQLDMLQILKAKLQTNQQELEETIKERDDLKQLNTKLESENSILLQEISRLRSALNEKNSQISNRYTMAVLENKLESYEKEIKQLHTALEQSDKYVADLENRLASGKDKEIPTNSLNQDHIVSTSNSLTKNFKNTDADFPLFNVHASSLSSSSSSSLSTAVANVSPMKFIKGDSQTFKTDLKVVKFEANDLVSPPQSSSSSSSCTHQSSNKKVVIANNRFYGSPSKNSPNKYMTITAPVHKISPFGDRIKKSLFSTTNTNNNEREASHNIDNPETKDISSKSCSNFYPTITNSETQQFLFSPMKRLRLDEASTCENECRPSSQMNSACLVAEKMPAMSTTEFDDCIELLNQAEKKVQNRQTSPKTPTKSLSPNAKPLIIPIIRSNSSNSSMNGSNVVVFNNVSKSPTSNGNLLLDNLNVGTSSSSAANAMHNFCSFKDSGNIIDFNMKLEKSPIRDNLNLNMMNNFISSTKSPTNQYNFETIDYSTMASNSVPRTDSSPTFNRSKSLETSHRNLQL